MDKVYDEKDGNYGRMDEDYAEMEGTFCSISQKLLIYELDGKPKKVHLRGL